MWAYKWGLKNRHWILKTIEISKKIVMQGTTNMFDMLAFVFVTIGAYHILTIYRTKTFMDLVLFLIYLHVLMLMIGSIFDKNRFANKQSEENKNGKRKRKTKT